MDDKIINATRCESGRLSSTVYAHFGRTITIMGTSLSANILHSPTFASHIIFALVQM